MASSASVPEPAAHGGALRVGVVAGEPSGDTLGAGLIEALAHRVPGVQCFGIAGPRMIAAGCEPWYRAEELSVMGLAEVVRHLPRLVRLRADLLRRLRGARPDVFVGIDSPDFNLPVEAALRRTGTPTVQYVSPQVWAWRQSRVAAVRRAADLVLCLLPFETAFYERHGVNARFVGHPLADEVPPETNKTDARAALGVPATGPYLGILPGSRHSEVSRLARPFMETARWLCAARPDLGLLVGLANEDLRAAFLQRVRPVRLDTAPRLFTGRAREVMGAADVVLTASGTASLETLLTKRPMVVAYIISGITHQLLRLLGLNRLDHFSLPNLLAGRPIVPEFLQGDVRAEVLGPALAAYLDAGDGQGGVDGWYDAFGTIHQQLRRSASAGAADAVLELLGNETRRDPCSNA